MTIYILFALVGVLSCPRVAKQRQVEHRVCTPVALGFVKLSEDGWPQFDRLCISNVDAIHKKYEIQNYSKYMKNTRCSGGTGCHEEHIDQTIWQNQELTPNVKTKIISFPCAFNLSPLPTYPCWTKPRQTVLLNLNMSLVMCHDMLTNIMCRYLYRNGSQLFHFSSFEGGGSAPSISYPFLNWLCQTKG